jgi:ribose transport system permease protein
MKVRWRIPSLSAWAGIWIATGALFLLSGAVQPESLSRSALLGMFPFAAILAIAAVGQTLVVQQGGIDLSVPGVVSITVVLVTHYPNGDASRLPAAIAMAYGVAIAAGAVNGLAVSRVGITPIVATLGMNAVLYGGVMEISGGTPRFTTDALHNFASSTVVGIPSTVLIAAGVTLVVGFLIKRTVAGRQFEAVGANPVAARAAGLEAGRYQMAAYVGAAVLYCTAAILLAGIIIQPSAFQGDAYLLPSVAAVVLGGTSLFGGVGSVVASAGGALFLTQLEQLVFTTGVNAGVQYLIEGGAIAAGVAIHSVRGDMRRWIELIRGRPKLPAVQPVALPESAGLAGQAERRQARKESST